MYPKKKDGAPKTEKDKRLEALMREKEQATKSGESWVAVLDTKVNEDNIRNGSLELDWNNEFIEKLLDAGYKGETNEQIVDGWFQNYCKKHIARRRHGSQTEAQVILMLKIWAKTNPRLVKEIK